ncbi:hypothetical protein OHA25_41600 [Nonomuraea sp. NBC_00507]|uniref:hypothetical protein n=1 Tax=Nonomuraea sp. NBC_00507 TaxID=2976002 RepID=UPI002E191A88
MPQRHGPGTHVDHRHGRLRAPARRLDYHEVLLDLLGCAELSPERVQRHLVALERAFAVHAPSYRFASDISEAG